MPDVLGRLQDGAGAGQAPRTASRACGPVVDLTTDLTTPPKVILLLYPDSRWTPEDAKEEEHIGLLSFGDGQALWVAEDALAFAIPPEHAHDPPVACSQLVKPAYEHMHVEFSDALDLSDGWVSQ